MTHNCYTCLHSINCQSYGNQCIDYEHGTQKEIKERGKEIKDILDSTVDISEYDDIDNERRSIINDYVAIITKKDSPLE